MPTKPQMASWSELESKNVDFNILNTILYYLTFGKVSKATTMNELSVIPQKEKNEAEIPPMRLFMALKAKGSPMHINSMVLVKLVVKLG